jgi:micrococcal nuclease
MPGAVRRRRRGLQALLNAGAFSLERRLGEVDRNGYGRLLCKITRGDTSLGDVMVSEGIAERWKGYRGNWC